MIGSTDLTGSAVTYDESFSDSCIRLFGTDDVMKVLRTVYPLASGFYRAELLSSTYPRPGYQASGAGNRVVILGTYMRGSFEYLLTVKLGADGLPDGLDGADRLIFTDDGSVYASSESAFIVWMIKIVTLVTEFCNIRKYKETVCKSLGDKELLFIVLCELNTVPLTESSRSFSQIHRYVKYPSLNDSYELVLRIFNLEMKAPEYAFLGSRLIVLYKSLCDSRFLKIIVIVSLHEISSVVTEDCGSNDLKSFYFTSLYTYLTHYKNLVSIYYVN